MTAWMWVRSITSIAMFVLLTSYFFLPAPVLAQQCVNNRPTPACAERAKTGTFIQNPACKCCGDCEISDFVGLAVEASRFIFGIAGSLALAMVVVGGFWFVTAAGSSERIEKGKKTMTAAAVGLLIVFGAWVLVNTILAALTDNFTSPGAVVTGEWWKVKK